MNFPGGLTIIGQGGVIQLIQVDNFPGCLTIIGQGEVFQLIQIDHFPGCLTIIGQGDVIQLIQVWIIFQVADYYWPRGGNSADKS